MSYVLAKQKVYASQGPCDHKEPPVTSNQLESPKTGTPRIQKGLNRIWDPISQEPSGVYGWGTYLADMSG